MVSSTFVVAGSVADFTEDKKSELADKFASAAGVSITEVVVTVVGASVSITVDILTSAAATPTNVMAALSTKFQSTSALSAFLGPSLAVELITSPLQSITKSVLIISPPPSPLPPFLPPPLPPWAPPPDYTIVIVSSSSGAVVFILAAVGSFFAYKALKKHLAAKRAAAEEARKIREAADAKAAAEAAAKAAAEAAAAKAAKEAEERKARAAREALEAKARAEAARVQAEMDAEERAIREAEEKVRAAKEQALKDAEMSIWQFHLSEAGAMAARAKVAKQEEDRRAAERAAAEARIEEMKQTFWSGSPGQEDTPGLIRSETRNGVLDHRKDLEFLWAGMGMLSHRGVSTTRGLEPHQIIAGGGSPDSHSGHLGSAGNSSAKKEPLTVTRELTFDEQEEDEDDAMSA